MHHYFVSQSFYFYYKGTNFELWFGRKAKRLSFLQNIYLILAYINIINVVGKIIMSFNCGQSCCFLSRKNIYCKSSNIIHSFKLFFSKSILQYQSSPAYIFFYQIFFFAICSRLVNLSNPSISYSSLIYILCTIPAYFCRRLIRN